MISKNQLITLFDVKDKIPSFVKNRDMGTRDMGTQGHGDTGTWGQVHCPT
jgi:hypothetical protein